MKYWCPNCKIKFSTTDEKGQAKCPECNYQRKDSFNLLSDGRLECVECGTTFPNNIQMEKISCINNKCKN